MFCYPIVVWMGSKPWMLACQDKPIEGLSSQNPSASMLLHHG